MHTDETIVIPIINCTHAKPFSIPELSGQAGITCLPVGKYHLIFTHSPLAYLVNKDGIRCKCFMEVICKLKSHFGNCFQVDHIGLKIPASDNEIWNYALKNELIIRDQ